MGKPVEWPEFDDDLERDEYMRQVEDFSNHIWKPAFKNYREHEDQMPMGSEGSLDWRYVDTNDINNRVIGKGSMIAIDGSLRDFGGEEDVRKTVKWFVRCCNELYARYAVLVITDDMSSYKTTVIYNWGTAYIYHNGDDFKEKIQRPKKTRAN